MLVVVGARCNRTSSNLGSLVFAISVVILNGCSVDIFTLSGRQIWKRGILVGWRGVFVGNFSAGSPIRRNAVTTLVKQIAEVFVFNTNLTFLYKIDIAGF